jgi:hypothetical protein
MRFSENLSNIAPALAKVQAEIKNPIKNQANKGVQGAPLYANLEDTLQDYVRPICSKYGISVLQSIKSDEADRVGVATTLLHESGEYIESDYVFCKIVVPTNRDGKPILTEGQATGVCITYLRRYSLNAALGINGDKDTDGSYSDKPVEEEPLTYETALALEITFGKYSGETLADIWKTDFSYIQWLASEKKVDARIKEAISIINAKIKENKATKEAEAEAKAEAITE